jgi:hypothetical protein
MTGFGGACDGLTRACRRDGRALPVCVRRVPAVSELEWVDESARKGSRCVLCRSR